MQNNDKESSLTSPSDRNQEKRWRPEQGVRLLTENEVDDAMKELNNDAFVRKFPRVDRTYADPPISMQNIALLSFVAAKGATPNEKGVFGFAKIRGSYATETEAGQRAEFLIRNVDSFNKIYHTYVGRPFPITLSSEYSSETSEIDIRRQTTETISNHVKEKKLEEQKIVRDMKDKEERLLEESKKNTESNATQGPAETDPYEEYITLRVKKAQLTWTFLEHLKKLHEVRDIIIKTRKDVNKLDKLHPTFKDNYFQKYMEAREKTGLDRQVTKEGQDNFIKYMVEDVLIPTIDTNDVLPSEVSTNRNNDTDLSSSSSSSDEDDDEPNLLSSSILC